MRHSSAERVQQRPDRLRVLRSRPHGRERDLQAPILRPLDDREGLTGVRDRRCVQRVHLARPDRRGGVLPVGSDREVVELVRNHRVGDGGIEIRPGEVVAVLESSGGVEPGELLDREVRHPAGPAHVGEGRVSELVGGVCEVADVQFAESVPRANPRELIGGGGVFRKHSAPSVGHGRLRAVGDRRRRRRVVEIARVDVIRVLDVQQTAACGCAHRQRQRDQHRAPVLSALAGERCRGSNLHGISLLSQAPVRSPSER